MSISKLIHGSYSRAKISLINLNGDTCVLKRSLSSDIRFSDSIAKQTNFSPITLEGLNISSAKVIKQNTIDGHLDIYMQYINGLSGDDFALHGDKYIATEISRGLSALLLNSTAKSRICEVNSDIFLNKMSQVVSATSDKNLLDALHKTSEKIRKIFISKNRISIPLGQCHGDLTLSNIILSPSKGLVLIDFLSTFLESPLQDLAKISQDLEFGWSFRRMDSNLQIKSRIFSQLAFPSYGIYLYTLFPEASYILKLLCLSRIAPYINDSVSAKWLIRSLDSAIIQKNFIND